MPDVPPAPRTRIIQANVPGVQALLTVVVGVAVVAALYVGREVLIPITLAVLLSFVLAPVVGLLRRLWLPRVPAVLLSVLLALGAILFLGGLIGTQVAQLAAEVPRYAATVERKVEAVRSVAFGRLTRVVKELESKLDAAEAAEDAEDVAAAVAAPADATPKPKPVPVVVREPTPSPLDVAGRILSPFLSPLATTAIVLVVAVFILLQREDLRDRLIRLFGSTDLNRTTAALDDAARRLSRYFLTQFGINTAYGVVSGAALFLIGLPGALLWGILAGLMRFVPYVGTPIAAGPPILLAAAVDPGWSLALLTAAYFLVGEGLMGQVVEPVAFGQSTGLSPASVVVAAIFWSWLWGPLGLILAMPLTLCLVVLGRHVEQFEFLDVLLGDRPALTPVESFYQRLLAGDPDEALDQCEALLKDRSLSSYYDEVALKGLQLAAADANRGVLPPERLEGIKDAVRGMVSDLDDHPDADPPSEEDSSDTDTPSLAERALPSRPAPEGAAPPAEALPPEWRTERAVLCIAGRGPLDEAASAMLAQLLGKHGLGAQVVPHEAVARYQVNKLDVAGVAMVCISYLEISGSPAHLRYLIRRLRQRLPEAPILVGLWPAEEPVLKDRQLQMAVGADYYTSSLREAVMACLDAAEKARAAAEPRSPAPVEA